MPEDDSVYFDQASDYEIFVNRHRKIVERQRRLLESYEQSVLRPQEPPMSSDDRDEARALREAVRRYEEFSKKLGKPFDPNGGTYNQQQRAYGEHRRMLEAHKANLKIPPALIDPPYVGVDLDSITKSLSQFTDEQLATLGILRAHLGPVGDDAYAPPTLEEIQRIEGPAAVLRAQMQLLVDNALANDAEPTEEAEKSDYPYMPELKYIEGWTGGEDSLGNKLEKLIGLPKPPVRLGAIPPVQLQRNEDTMPLNDNEETIGISGVITAISVNMQHEPPTLTRVGRVTVHSVVANRKTYELTVAIETTDEDAVRQLMMIRNRQHEYKGVPTVDMLFWPLKRR